MALAPFGRTVLDNLKDKQFDVIGVGKIPDIFVDQGITKAVKTVSNQDGMEKLLNLQNQNLKDCVLLIL